MVAAWYILAYCKWLALIVSVTQDGHLVRVNRDEVVVSLTRPDDFGAATFEQGAVTGFLQDNRLPPEILNERRRGAQGTTWFRSLEATKDKIAADIDRLDASTTASRLLDVPRLKKLMAEWPADEHAAQLREAEYAFALARGVHVG